MKFDPISKKLFTDDGHFLKRLSCPRHATRQQMSPAGGPRGAMLCHQCDKTVHDTAHLTDTDVRQLLEKTPDACLAIGADQKNVILTRR